MVENAYLGNSHSGPTLESDPESNNMNFRQACLRSYETGLLICSVFRTGFKDSKTIAG